jgi:uncharacterized protein YggU (UPF0235/DUF167 family)|tara:strand:- start:387 stop:596 length:210 start_codon:yes stop_codon:yes gene_type:complete
LIYSVQVEFNKEFLEIEDNIIRIGLLSKPVKGEANKELIKKIAKRLSKPTSSIVIKSGHKNTKKIIQVS